MSDLRDYYDTYDINNYATPVKPKTANKNEAYNVFNPYQNTHQEDADLPETVDLTKNAYARQESTIEFDDEQPLLEGIYI